MLEHLTIAKKSSVLTLHEEGYAQLNIARKLKINQATVSRIIQ
jgi:transcriptional regulator